MGQKEKRMNGESVKKILRNPFANLAVAVLGAASLAVTDAILIPEAHPADKLLFYTSYGWLLNSVANLICNLFTKKSPNPDEYALFWAGLCFRDISKLVGLMQGSPDPLRISGYTLGTLTQIAYQKAVEPKSESSFK